MTIKQLIAFGTLFLIILALIIYIVLRQPNVVIDNQKINMYKDSIITLKKNISIRNDVIQSRNLIIDSLEKTDKTKEIKYVTTIHFINKPTVSIKHLDSIIRSIAFPKK